MNKTLKIILWVICAEAILFGGVVGASYIPRRIDKTLSGVELLCTGTAESEIVQRVEITIKGWLHNGMFSRPRYSGYFIIDAYDYTADCKITVIFKDHFYYRTLNYMHFPLEWSNWPKRYMNLIFVIQ